MRKLACAFPPQVEFWEKMSKPMYDTSGDVLADPPLREAADGTMSL